MLHSRSGSIYCAEIMPTSNQDWLALAVSASFAAGLNVYATIATLGILSRTGVLPLPPALYLIQDWWVIAIAGVMFALEFVADKIPVIDLVWNALHTFIRVPVGALIAYGATQHMSPTSQALAAAMGGTLALVSHSSKFAARTLVTPSPEPVSNSVLSVGEDVGAIGLTWFATHHPYVAAGFTGAAVVALVIATRWIVRGIRSAWTKVSARFAPA
ncbi:MAG: hypothetical protein NVS9B15_22820 [Acidobacteriaceae bacterium]